MESKIPITKEIITIDKDQGVTEAMKIMDKKNISHLLVRDKGKFIGLITERDIANKFANFHDLKTEHKLREARFHVSSAMNKNLKTIPPSTRIRDAARIMVEDGISSLPVVENNEVIGIVTKTDLINKVKASKKEIGMFYNKVLVTVPSGSSIVHARKIMLKNNIHRILVTDDNGNLIGILSQKAVAHALKEFRRALDKYLHADVRKLKVEDYMKKNPITITKDTSISDASEIMLEKGISGLPVIDEPLGILTKTDIVRGIADGKLP